MSRTVLRRLAPLFALLAFSLLGGSAAAATVNVSVSADPTEEKALTLTVSGSAETSKTLYVYVGTANTSCSTNAFVSGFSTLSGYYGTSLGAGSFSKTFDYTPQTQDTYRVCAYIAADTSSTPSAKTSFDFTPRAPLATLSVSASADPTEEKSLSFTVQGTTEVARTLYVYVGSANTSCSTNAFVSGFSTLSGYYGTAINTGTFTKTFDYTPGSDGSYRLCAYVAESTSSTPNAVLSQEFAVSPPASTLDAVVSAGTFSTGDTVSANFSGSSAGPGRRLAFVWASGNCPPTGPARYSDGSVDLQDGATTHRTLPRKATAGDQVLRACAYIMDGEQVEASYSAASVRATPPAAQAAVKANAPLVYTLLTKDGEIQYDRLRLSWRGNGATYADETLLVWDEDPQTGADPVVEQPTDSDALEFSILKNGDSAARVRTFLGFRKFWWQIQAENASGVQGTSPIGTVEVVPSPMSPSDVKVSVKRVLTKSSKRPGTVRLRVASSPRARVKITVMHRGRTFASRKYTESVGGLRGFDFTLSCARTGLFHVTASIQDPYGEKVTRRTQWSLSASRCASLRAAERAKERAKRRPSGGSGGGGGGSTSSGGGSGCHPNYSGCLKQNAGDYDCAGGGGNGPNYVSGPVSVYGSDPFDLDRDGDGVGCES